MRKITDYRIFTKDSILQLYTDICKNYGLTDSQCIKKLAYIGLKMFQYLRFERYGKMYIEERQFIKDLATIINILKNGTNIKIKAEMPNNKHISLNFENGDLLQIMTLLNLNSLLEYNIVQNSDSNILEKKTIEEYNGYHLIGFGERFKEPYTDKELADIIEHEEKMISNEKNMKGRTEQEIPLLGRIVHTFIMAGGDMLASLSPTEKYCLIGDLMFYSEFYELDTFETFEENEEEWRNISNKDRADKVKSWEKSWENAKEKIK